MKTININGKDFTIEELNDIIGGSKQETKTLEQRKEAKFLELFQGLEMRSDIEEYPNSVFFFKNNNLMLEKENTTLWVSCDGIWKIFKGEFGMKNAEIEGFIKGMMEKHFKMTGVTPANLGPLAYPRMEKHFKMTGVTPKAASELPIW